MEWTKMLLDQEFWMSTFERFSVFAPIMAICLVMLEAFVPVFPLYVFVAINVMAFGFWQGYLYSWIGNCAGTIIVFLLIRKVGTSWFQRRIEKSRRIKNIFMWIHRHGFFPIFLLMTFPFTPSFVISGLSALSRVEAKTFFGAILFGKLFMILSLSFIGYNVSGFLQQPLKSSIYIVLTLSISLLAKIIFGQVEKHLEKRYHRSKQKIT